MAEIEYLWAGAPEPRPILARRLLGVGGDTGPSWVGVQDRAREMAAVQGCRIHVAIVPDPEWGIPWAIFTRSPEQEQHHGQ